MDHLEISGREVVKSLLALFALPLVIACASCRLPNDDSAYAATAGQSTIVLGACGAEFNVGWGQCLIEKGSALPFPTLKFIMTNPGEWAVSDCGLGLYRTGSVGATGLVEVDLSGLQSQAEKNGFCILKIETVEKHKNIKDPRQNSNLYMRGGFFLEIVDPGYFPTPAPSAIAFCVKVKRTIKGRTVIEKCTD